MSEEHVLEATHRKVVGKQVKQLRRDGKLPAVVYGHGVDPTPIVLDLRETTKIMKDIGSSTLVTLRVDDKDYAVLVREQQKGILTRQLEHIDFLAIAMDQTVRTQVAVVILDEEVPAARDYGAMIVTGLDALDVECLPIDLPDHIEVNASVLENIGDNMFERIGVAFAGGSYLRQKKLD